VVPSHGHGRLKPWRKGETGRVSNVASRFVETQQLARQHSMEAIRTLVERMKDPDGRVAVVAANSILERAWGKVREQKPEEQQQVHIDLTTLSAVELAILVKLAESGRLRSVPSDGSDDVAPVIEAAPGRSE
jgi:hypothetical protein